VTWSSSDTSIAPISNETEHPGLLTAIAPGEVTVTAAFEDCETEKSFTIISATWIKSFGGSENIEPDPSGRSGTGLYWDVYLLKVDPDGNLIWESTWGERSDESGPYNEKARSVTEVADGGFIITGTTDHTETIVSGTEEDSLLLLRVDESGAPIWRKSFSGGPFVIRRGLDVLEAREGGFVVLEQSIATAPADGLCSVMKTDRSGDVEWSRICKPGGGRWSGFGLAIAEAVDDGGYVIAGYDYCDSLNGNMGIDLMKIDRSGEFQWYKCYMEGMGVSVQKTGDGGYVVLGNSQTGFNAKSVTLIKTDDDGQTDGE